MRHICLTSALLISILQLLNKVNTLEYIFPQSGGHNYNDNGRPNRVNFAYTSFTLPPKNVQPSPSLNNDYHHSHQHQLPKEFRHPNKVRQRQENPEGGEGVMTHEGGEGVMTHEGGGQSSKPEEGHSSFTMNVKKLGVEGISKIVLAISPFVICIIFVPLLIIVIGTLLIPIVRLHSYAEGENAEGRDLGGLGVFNNKEEEMIHRVISSIESMIR